MKTMKTVFNLIICMIAISDLLYGQGNETFKWEKQIDSMVYSQIGKSAPGGAIGVIMDGKIVFTKAYGFANLDNKTENTIYTKFNLASVSKQFTAYACLLLANEKKLDLDADIHIYLPELPDFGEKITTRELLHHTSGISNVEMLLLFSGSMDKVWGMEDEIGMIKKYNKLNYKPNEEHLYSNTGYSIAARIVEKISGKSLADFLAQNVFQPLKMKNSDIYDSYGKTIENKANGYAKNDSMYVQKNTLTGFITGSTNLYTSVSDMMLWDQHLLNPAMSEKELISKIYYPADTLNNGDTIKYTYGFENWTYKGLKVTEHSGYTFGFVTRNMLFPEQNFAVVMLFNNEATNNWVIPTKIVDWVLADKIQEDKKKERKEITIDSKLYAVFEGTYKLDDGMALPFKNINDTLWLTIPDAPKFRMVPESETDFFINEFDAQCTFVMEKDGSVNKIIWHQSGQNPEAIRDTGNKNLSAEDLKRYEGFYYEPVISAVYQIRVEKDRLILTLPEIFKSIVHIGPDVNLNYCGNGNFYIDHLGLVQFPTDSNNIIKGLTFKDVGRQRDIEFLKAN
jgi:CubicO group peptidase (beta-lactamase class C family)